MGESDKTGKTRRPDIITGALPDGTAIVYPGHPGVVLQELPGARHTGVCDFEWSKAQTHIGDSFTPGEVRAGWPHRLSPTRLANLQFPQQKSATGEHLPSDASARQNWVVDALTGLCERGEIKGELIRRILHDASPNPQPPMQWLEYWIDPKTFLDWLAVHHLEPSRFIAAWCKANGVQVAEPMPPAAVGKTTETAEQRQSRRYQMCIDAGLPMPDNDYAILPDGIKNVAAAEGISVQAFSKDVKKHIARMKAQTGLRT